jgi:hypothetical protein
MILYSTDDSWNFYQDDKPDGSQRTRRPREKKSKLEDHRSRCIRDRFTTSPLDGISTAGPIAG